MTTATSTTSSTTPKWAWALLVLFMLVYVTQAWRSVQQVNILIDEVTDTHIADMLRTDPLFGTGNDGSQARLPMYATAFTHTIATRIHPAGNDLSILTSARATSIAVGAVGIALLFLVARRWFDTTTALLAAGILAIAPYFLNLSRTAMTEGDAYCPTAVLLGLFTFGLYQAKRTTPRLVLFGVAAGLMAATKFYLVALLPAFFICDILAPSQQRRLDDQPTAIKPIVILWAVCAALLMALSAGLTQLSPIPDAIEDRAALTPAAIMWLVAAVLLIGGVLFFTLRKPPLTEGTEFPTWSTLPAWFAIAPLAAAVTFVFPEHALNQKIMGTFLGRVFGWDESTPGSGYGEAARLYGSLILLKLSIPLGVMTMAAVPWILWQAIRHAGARLVAATLIMYGFVLIVLPVRQHFYLMAAYPVMILMLAAFITTLAKTLPAKPLRYGWSTVAAASVAYLLWGHIQVFPTYGYYGYEVTGNHWLGSEPRGYRDIVQVTSDGTFDALDWLAQNTDPQHKVYSYLSLRDRWTVNRYEDERGIPFNLIHHDPELARDVDQVPHADYILIAMQNRVSYNDAPSEDAIATRYSTEPVHTIYRGRGKYRLPVANIYQSKHLQHAKSFPTPDNDHIANAQPSE